MRIVCIKEFRDKFNLHESNTTSNDVNLRARSIFLVSTAIGSSHHASPTGFGNKSKNSMKNE